MAALCVDPLLALNSPQPPVGLIGVTVSLVLYVFMVAADLAITGDCTPGPTDCCASPSGQRCTHATLLVELGSTARWVQERLGYCTITTTSQKAAVDRFAAHLGEAQYIPKLRLTGGWGVR